MSHSIINTQAVILERALAKTSSAMTPEAANYFLSIELDPHDAQRANELAHKAREGSLTVEEQSEIDEYRRVGRFVEMLKLRAKAAL